VVVMRRSMRLEDVEAEVRQSAAGSGGREAVVAYQDKIRFRRRFLVLAQSRW